jgi:hypothetical protein
VILARLQRALRKAGFFATTAKLFLLVLFSLRSATLCRSQELSEWTDTYVIALAPAQDFSGIIVAGRDGKVLIEKSYGSAVEEW